MGIDQSPYGNGESLFPFGDANEMIPISIWGSPYRNGSPFPNGDRSVTNPFPNRVRAHLGIEVKITIWECFPYGDHRFHMVITVRKWAGRLEYSHMGNPRFRIEFVSIWGPTHIIRILQPEPPLGKNEKRKSVGKKSNILLHRRSQHLFVRPSSPRARRSANPK